MKTAVEETAYRIYVTDALKVITDNQQKHYGGDGYGYLKKRYYDLIRPAPQETRTGEEIIAHICAKLEALGGDENGRV